MTIEAEREPALSQGLPLGAGRRREDSSLEPSEGAWSCPHLAFGLAASRAVREYISVVLSHQSMVLC